MSITCIPGQGPVRVGIPICDLTSGMFLAQGILIALLDREVTGEGQWVHTSLLESIIQMLDFQASRWTMAGEVAPQAGNNHPTSIPTGVYPTSDGHINIAASGAELYKRFCKAIGANELLENPEYQSFEGRSKNRDELNQKISEITKTRPGQEWIDLLNDAGVPCGPIYSIDQVFADPHVQHLRMARPATHATRGEINIIGQAVNLTATPEHDRIMRATPERGEHTDDVLREAGYDDAAIKAFRASGTI